MRHLKSATEVERILAWRSDDFEHDGDALLRAESQALHEIGEDYLTLQSRVQELETLIHDIYKAWTSGHQFHAAMQSVRKYLGEK